MIFMYYELFDQSLETNPKDLADVMMPSVTQDNPTKTWQLPQHLQVVIDNLQKTWPVPIATGDPRGFGRYHGAYI